MQTHYNVKETTLWSLRLNQIMKQSRGFQANEASDVIDHVLLAKRIKLRYSVSMSDVSFFDTSFEATVSNVTLLVICMNLYNVIHVVMYDF